MGAFQDVSINGNFWLALPRFGSQAGLINGLQTAETPPQSREREGGGEIKREIIFL